MGTQMMKRRICLILVLVALLCGCVRMEGNAGSTPSQIPEPTTTIYVATQPTATTTTVPTVPTTVPTEPVGPAPVVNMYAGAMEDYLLPLETYSDERLYAPEMVMIHFCSAVKIDENDPYNIDLIRSTFVDYEVSTHYIIERDGTIRCYIPEDRVAWHAGKGQWHLDEKYTNAMNQYAIGIEMVAMGSKNDMKAYLTSKEYDALDQSLMGYTSAQYEALRALVNDLCLRYDIPLDRDHIIGHQEYASKKRDPGELFDWSQIVPEE